MSNTSSLFAAAFSMGKCGLGDGEVRVLTLLRDYGPQEVGALAFRLKYPSRAPASTALAVARKRGHVTWAADEADSRRRIYTISSGGLRALRDAEEKFANHMREAVGMLRAKAEPSPGSVRTG